MVSRGRGSQQKGKRGEREARKFVKIAFYPNGDGDVVRSPRSGAWGGEKVLSGDLIPIYKDRIDYRFPFFFEVKNVQRKTFNSFRFLAGDTGLLVSWLKKAAKQSLEGTYVLILWKVDFSEWFVYMSFFDFNRLSASFGSFPQKAVVLKMGDSLTVPVVCGFVNLRVLDFVKWFKADCFTIK